MVNIGVLRVILVTSKRWGSNNSSSEVRFLSFPLITHHNLTHVILESVELYPTAS